MSAIENTLKEDIIDLGKQYPSKEAALIPALHLVQNKVGYISDAVILELSELLNVPTAQIQGVVTFYTMFRQKPAGKHQIKICRNISCQLRGAQALIDHAQTKLNISLGETTDDKRITLETEECLASCGTAPMLWCDGVYHENLDIEALDKLLDSLE